MHEFLVALTVILGVAATTTVIFRKIRQPVILGYLLAGLIVGPHLPIPIFANETIAQELSEIGVILLMFSLGLEFSLRKLIRVAPTAGLVAIIQCSLMIWLPAHRARIEHRGGQKARNPPPAAMLPDRSSEKRWRPREQDCP